MWRTLAESSTARIVFIALSSRVRTRLRQRAEVGRFGAEKPQRRSVSASSPAGGEANATVLAALRGETARGDENLDEGDIHFARVRTIDRDVGVAAQNREHFSVDASARGVVRLPAKDRTKGESPDCTEKPPHRITIPLRKGR